MGQSRSGRFGEDTYVFVLPGIKHPVNRS